MERDAVHKALMSLLRQDVKGNLIFFNVKYRRLVVKCYVSNNVKGLSSVNVSYFVTSHHDKF